MPIIYENSKYNFQISIPSWWKRWAFIGQGNCSEGALACFNFKLRYRKAIKGKRSTTIFRIDIFKMTLDEWKSKFADSPYKFLGNANHFIYSAIWPEEPPNEFLLPDESDFNRNILEFKVLLRMINEDLPKILASFRFI